MWGARAWLVLAAVAWSARAGPGPPDPPPPAPTLAFAYALYNLSIAENSGPRTAAAPPPAAPPLGVPLLPGAHVRFRIRHGDKDKFFKAEERTVGDFCFCFIRTRAGHADVLNRERKDFYKLEIRATAQLPSGKQLEADTVVAITITDVNDLSPLFYPTEYDVLVPEDTPAHASVARVSAEDADVGLNGEIYYSLEEPTDQFAVHPASGVVSLTRPLVASEKARHELAVLARDRQSLLMRGDDAPAARASLIVRVARANLHAPEIRARRLPELVENSATEVYAIVAVTDRDAGEHGRIASVEIVGGDPDGHFRVRPSAQPGEWDVVAHALLDRERTPRGYNLTLRAKDAGHPPRASYLTLPVTITDANDNAPVFSRELYECTVSETAPPDTPVIRLKVTDRDEGRNARVYIEIVGGNEGGEFRVNPDTGVLYTARELDAELRALHTLTVAAVDHGNAGTRKQSSAKVQVAVLDANDNDPVFEQDELDVAVPENGAAGAVVARVTARDADSGENAYISYSLANLQPVPFDVDHFSGAVRTARVLDYESMRRDYMLRVRASDWGLPYRRQAELRLRVRLLDVNDNRPQFERVDCVGYLPRRLPAGAEIVTLSAIDFDAGDVVSYRIVGGNDDNCFALDSGTGVLSLACDLASVRADSRVLNVTATDGTHFADPTSLVLHLTGTGAGPAAGALECRDTGVARRLTELLAAAERSNAPLDADEFPLAPSRYGENLHAPEFVDFPVEVKVNESVALGTTLVKLTARDRDLGYNGLLTFGISGGDPDSAFRIEPDSGELQVIGYLDRERESEYYLNVSVWDSGKPRRVASRLLPVTVLDVNDNAPRFEKTLASFRVTENAINGTAIFRANATDRDAGDFAKITYSLAGGADGEFCVERDTGVLRVCAPLDRERRALYELSLRATDGGGRAAEALVRVAVDDVNDCAPRFGLASYSARVPEDVPKGTLVAVLEAFDADLGAGGRVTYSLPDQSPDDAVFTVDELSGVLRTAKRLDFEEKQVHGVTVRATDGGQPALWSEATLIVEVLDVDENAHAPMFAERVLAGSVREDAAPGARVLSAQAHDADPPGRDSRLAYYIVGGSGMAHFSIDDTGVIRTLSPLDREATPHYWLTVCAQDHGLVPKHTCAEVYIEIEDVNDMAPWPERASYTATVPEHCAAGTRVAVVHAVDSDASPVPANITYAIVAGNPDGLFSIDEHTGEIVTTGRTLDREATSRHALEVSCSDGELATTVRVLVTLLDINDHAPAFTQRFYEVRVPAAVGTMQADQADEEGSSAEWDSDDEDDGSGARPSWDEDDSASGVYVASVAALDDDAGANGTVRYSWRARGAARGALRLHATSGRLYAARALRRHDAFDITVRACDGGAPPRCGVARVSVRGAARGGGGAPALQPPAPLQAAELDAPGFLLAVLQATDPDGDRVYYDIVDGDEWNEFLVGREDGSLVLTRRLLHERRARYALTVAATDGTNTVTAVVNITVINDANEAGVSFSRQEYVVDVSEAARAGEALAALRASAGEEEGQADKEGGTDRLLYGLHAARAPASARLFRLHEITGVLELAQPLDRESAHIHELTVWARDQAPRASRAFARVTVRVHDADEHAPEWRRRLAEARLARNAAPGALVAALRAADRDAGDAARIEYSLAGGDVSGLFKVDPVLGDVRLASPLPSPPLAPREYTLVVRAANPPPHARASTLPLHVTIVEPDDAPPVLASDSLVFEVAENSPRGTVLGAIEARGAALRFSLTGGEGRFALNPSAGLLVTATELDYEEQAFYNLTVTVLAMGGGTATARIAVHVLDRNEFPPVFVQRRYRGRVSEAASAGSLVARADADAPLVLTTADADSPAHRQRAFEILQPAAAALFAVHPTTGALLTHAPLDYETAREHEFTVKVVDMGSPRLPSDSTATVIIEVLDVNDCAPTFEHSSYEATVLLPTAAGVLVQTLKATDADLPADTALKYDIIEGDTVGAFSVSPEGAVSIARPDLLPETARLRIRASDGRWAGTTRLTVRARAAEPAGLAFAQPEYYGAVAENSTRPATVAVLSVLGAALNEHVEFSILNPVEGFEVGPTSGAVRSTGLALDRETRDSYVLLVQARSGGGESARVAHARLAVSVTDVNDNCPVFVGRPYVAAVPAGAEPGSEVITVRADDADANDNGEVRYEMKRGHGELFRVDRRSGRVTLKQTLDAHAALYELVIAAFDGGVPACGADAPVTVRVWAGGAAPRWDAAHYSRTAREDATPGSPLPGPLAARSPLQRPLIYSLVDPPKDPATGAPLFEIHFDTGSLVPALPLDFERVQEYSLVVRATDGVTGASADALVTLRVLDVNDCAPEFEKDLYDVEVSEAAAPGTTIMTFVAKDNDTGVNGEVTYSVSGANSSLALFLLDASTGALQLVAPLDAETAAQHRLLVTASDGGRPALRSTAHLVLRVKDVNDSPPRVERTVISALVSEEAARGVVLARVAAWDPDAADAARLRYAAVDAPAAPLLAVDDASGLVSLAAPRGWPTDAPRSLNVSVSDGAHAAFARVKLTVVPANKHAPRFPHLVYEARVMENLAPPVLLTTVKAYDEDGGEYGTVSYSIESALLRETFALDASTGALTTRAALDREARAEWEVPVAARDGGGRVRHTTVRVRVLDANGHAPEFPLREYRASARADLAPHAPFLTLTARDADAGDHAKLRYELYDGELHSDATGLFEIDSVTGALAFARNASAFASRSVVVWVRARDGGGRAGEAGVAVYVLGADEAAPRVQPPPPALFLREDAPPGTLLAELRATLAPGEPAPKYRLAPALHARDQFSIDEQGRLVLSAPLDREAAAEHAIGIVCEGPGSPAPALLLQTSLHVLDVNDHAPVFHSQPYVVHLAENTPPHSTVVRLMATDPDAGSNGEVRFSLGAGADAELFAVDALSGWVTTRAPLDREARAELRVPVVASDQAPPPSRRTTRGTLVVRLQDYNDCPPRFSPEEYTASVPEDAAAGTVVARLGVQDADAAAAPLAFVVAAGDPRARFQLRPSGELLVARALDRESEAEYELSVVATDGKFDARAMVHVTVTDVNDNPPYCVRHRYRATLSEDAAPGARVAALETRDADLPPHDALRYYLEGDAHDHFTIDKDTGEVRVARALDRETRAAYSLRMHAQDRARAAWKCSSELLVTLSDVNDNAPKFSAELYSVTLPEDAEMGTLVAKVHASDPDLGENRLITYSFVEEEGGDGGVFSLAGDSGVLTLRAPLDREAAAAHRVVLRATDAGTPPRSATAALRLTVADVNDNPPEFEFREYRASAPELDAPGTEILRVRATSRDTGVNAEVFYSLVAGDDREDFAVDRSTGAVSIARPLDYERRRAYLLTIQALDGGAPPLSDLATLNISVVDANDNAPVFAQASYAARVREDAPIGTRVLQLIADDADDGANGRVAYSIARGDRDGKFAIDEDTGYLSVAAPLDRETVASYTLEIRARDRGLPALEAAVRVAVEVLDANDNPPLFERANYSVVVQEDRQLGHALLRLGVTDADAAPNARPYTFDFQAGNEAGAFRLEQDGTLRTAARFNHRVKERYALQIRVFDNGAPPLYSDAWVHVRVIEESQYPPVVTPLEIQVNSYLDEFPGGVLGRVVASDRDAYDTLAYALAPAAGAPRPPHGLFEIDASDGTLRAAPRLDVGEYRLNVTVADGKFVSHALVRVSVLLVSDALLAQAVIVRFRAVSAEDFVLSHRKGFVRAVREATDCEPGDVMLLGAQPSGDDDWDEPSRSKRQVARDLDVALAVRGLAADALRRRLHAHLERVEERARLVVEELVRAACGGCVHGACAERVELRAERTRAVASDVFALVAPPLRLRGVCACEAGYKGPRCEQEAECNTPDCAPAAPRVLQLSGDGYLWLRVERGVVAGDRVPEDELALTLRFRTRRDGTLAWLAGRVDYAILEIVEGFVQFRMELGSGPMSVRAPTPVADGEWHEARLERRGAAARLTVDRRAARTAAPPPAALLDARADRLLIGAALARHAHALAPEQVTLGFVGCITDITLGGTPVPLEEGAGAEEAAAGPRVQLVRRVRARLAAACTPLAPPTPCSSYPCLNGGTCHELGNLLEGDAAPEGEEGYACTCHARFLGRRCEVDGDPCAAQPCLHGGFCAAAPPGSALPFVCACAAGLRGARCELGRWCGDELPRTGDAERVCQHGGACEEGEWGPSCRCRGYYGPRCEYDVDECAGEPCLNGATCLNEPGSFRCLCPPDKTGMNCGNPLYSDAVVAGGAGGGVSVSGARSLREAWRWACEARWPLAAAAGALLLLLLIALLPLALIRRRGRRREEAAPLNSAKAAPRSAKLSNLEARARPSSCAGAGPGAALNNLDTLRSYGSAGDELEGLPPDIRRNLNLDPNGKPWSEQMHLHSFVDNKIYNDLKGCKNRLRAVSPVSTRRGMGAVGDGAGALVGGYHWDCSDWCGGGGLPGISEVAGSERPDSSEPSPPSLPSLPSPPLARRGPRVPVPLAPAPPPFDTDSAPDDHDLDADAETTRFTDASSYLLHPDTYLPPAEDAPPSSPTPPRRRRDPDAASLITMLEERHSLLGGGSCSDVSAHLCEIEESDAENDDTWHDSDADADAAAPPPPARHTDV